MARITYKRLAKRTGPFQNLKRGVLYLFFIPRKVISLQVFFPFLMQPVIYRITIDQILKFLNLFSLFWLLYQTEFLDIEYVRFHFAE